MKKSYRDKIEGYLIRYGAGFNMGIKKVWQYYLIKLAASLICMFIASHFVRKNWLLCFGLVGYIAVDILIREMNKMDNDEMFADLKTLYDTFRIQQTAGIYLTNAIVDSYLMVKNKRLKEALKQVSKEIMSERDIVKAVENMSQKFRNDYIDEFVTVIVQSVETGQMVNMLEQINHQMINIEDVLNQKRESRIERKMLIIELLMFIGILAMAIYGLSYSAVTSIRNL